MESFAHIATGTVTSGGTTAPSAGTSQSWTVTATAAFPLASSSTTPPTWFYAVDPAAVSELFQVTVCPGGTGSGQSWTVTRGANGTTVTHSAGFTVDQVGSAYTFGAFPQYFNVRSPLYGATGNGTTDDTTAIQAAIAACQAAGTGTVYFPAGTYKHSGTLSYIQNMNWLGEGSESVFLNYTGSTQAVTVSLSGTFTGGTYAGTFRGFTLSGYSAGSSAVGLQYGNLQGIDISDVVIEGFGGKGFYAVNSSGDWAEQNNIRIRVEQCGTAGTPADSAVVFDTSSFDYSNFDYSNFDFLIVTGNGTGGITLQNGAQLQGCCLRVRGDFYGTSGNTAAVIAIDPGNTSGTSYITNALCDIAVESAGSGTGHYTLLQGSTSSTSQFTGTGVFSFSPVGPAFQGYSTAGASFSFAGIINDPVIGTTTPGEDGLMVYGQTITNGITVLGNGNFASGNPVMFLNSASQSWQFFCDKNTGNWGVYDQTHSATGLQVTPSTLNVQVAAGNVDVQTAGKGLQVAEGSNAKQGTLTLNGTTAVVVSNTSVTANSRIFLTIQSPAGTPGSPYVSARTASTSFSVKSTASGDTSTCAYEIFEPG